VSSVRQRFLSVQDVVQSSEQQEFYVPGHDCFTPTTTTGRRRQRTQAQNDHRLFHKLYIELAVNLHVRNRQLYCLFSNPSIILISSAYVKFEEGERLFYY
jgi:hypothetical protein